MTTVAFVTHRATPGLAADDRLAADLLESRGVSVIPAVWDDPAVLWPRFAAVVIRSAWDYHHHARAYADWLRRRAGDGTNLWNPAAAVLANLDKRYLTELAGSGVGVVPTTYLPAGGGRSLRDVLAGVGGHEAVVKPAVSASAHGTWRTSLATAAADQGRFEEQSRAGDVLVQPYLSEVAEHGEWSLVFFRGRFSHAVRKRPAPGDFRVQEEFGGRASGASPPRGWVEEAAVVLARVGSPLLYARVDAAEHAGRFALMELEINEPSLFLAHSPEAPARFAEAIEAVLSPR